MLIASAKASVIAMLIALALVAGIAVILLAWILLPEARPHMRAALSQGRRAAFSGFGK